MSRKKRGPEACAHQFSQEDFKYRIDDFLISGHDTHGQSVRLMCRVPPLVERALEVIVASRRFPYQTISDVVRHAILRHLEWLHMIEADIPKSTHAMLQVIVMEAQDKEMGLQIQQTFAKLDGLVEQLIASGERAEALRILSVCKGQLTKLQDSRWKRVLTEQFAAKYARHFGSMITSAPAPVLDFPEQARDLGTKTFGEE